MADTIESSEVLDNNQQLEDCTDQVDSHCRNGFFSIISDIPGGIWAISFFGFFLGMSTTMVYSQISLFQKNDLGLDVLDIANLDGIVESASFVTRIFAGPISDFFRQRKLILWIGCLITLGTRSLLPFVGGYAGVLGVQFSERVGNGMQATPRDALIADITPRNMRGKVYGLTRSIKTAGAFLGGIFALILMARYNNQFRTVFCYAVIPVTLAAVCLIFVKDKNKDKEKKVETRKRENPFKRKYLRSLDFSFWKLILLAFLFQLGHFTEHLFPIYMQNFVGTRVACSVGTVISMGQVMLAFTIGACADKFGKGRFIRFCMSVMVLSNLLFLLASYITGIVDFTLDLTPIFGKDFIINSSACCVYLGVFLWGGQLSAIEGLFLAIICEQVVFHLRATAIGIYSLVLGMGYWMASRAGGWIWQQDYLGSRYTFMYSLFFCVVAFALSFVLLPKKYNMSISQKAS